MLRFDEECVSSKVDFWSRFIDLYYQGVGGSVSCCSGDNCNAAEPVDKPDIKHKDPIRYCICYSKLDLGICIGNQFGLNLSYARQLRHYLTNWS